MQPALQIEGRPFEDKTAILACGDIAIVDGSLAAQVATAMRAQRRCPNMLIAADPQRTVYSDTMLG